MSEFEPSLRCFCVVFSLCFPFFFLGGWVGGVTIAAAPMLLFFIPYPEIYPGTCFSLSKLPNVEHVAYLFFWPLL